jgi:hypothetical protein
MLQQEVLRNSNNNNNNDNNNNNHNNSTHLKTLATFAVKSGTTSELIVFVC